MASVRFICGTQTVHKDARGRARAPSCAPTTAILYSSCFDANGGLFETLLAEEDAVISDELNHASIVDGIRLCKAERYRYRNNDMADLEAKLEEADAAGARFKLIATDGVFSMDGIVADLHCDLRSRRSPRRARRWSTIRTRSASSATPGAARRSSAASKAASTSSPERSARRWAARPAAILPGGGRSSSSCASARGPISFRIRSRRASPPRRSRCSNCWRSDEGAALRRRVRDNGERFRREMSGAGFDLVPGRHPIIPVMLGDAALATRMADALLEEGIYVIGFSYPVVPKGKARIRTQMSAAHTADEIDQAVAAFAQGRPGARRHPMTMRQRGNRR